MGEYSFEILADSVDVETRTRITTMRLCYPWLLHVEFMTHRMFARNSQSRRATNVEAAIEGADFEPTFYGPSEGGSPMNAGAPLAVDDARAAWLDAGYYAEVHAKRIAESGAHRFFSGAVLCPYSWIWTIVTSTSWANFYSLRCADGVEPHMRKLADGMRAAQAASVPVLRGRSWHLPGVTQNDRRLHGLDALRMLSGGRMARVSFPPLSGGPVAVEADIRCGIRRASDRHMSPFEHAARPQMGRHGVYDNWRSARADMVDEYVPDAPYHGPTVKEEG